ncbi:MULTISPECIES: ABC transporter permease [unclassified Clostridioides]|uniref:ABC transporter permease n=1 Tax=unclassified Clostridioides TaxID=2635829 RepID=UPI0006BC0BE3|nr:ABC transporter permease [Clostridioides sp. ZZV14-6387]MCI9977327.1 ABC transporter permease [Clostridioides difficile]MDI7817072.1 ABC transporter permease [Clostridioides difficile]NJI79222.1 ABC transporter permease [Clostridioides difficile]CZR98360.1 Oligopeptide transport system permease protein OppB [Clostridioides difficile]
MSSQMRYIGKRLLYSVLTVWVLISITFLLMQMLPGDPFSGVKVLNPDVKAALATKYGLDKPILEQYGIYVNNLIHGDLGSSIVSGRQVTDIIAQAFPVSLELGIRALIFAIILGILSGIVAALKHRTKWDTLTMILVLLGVSVPSFIMGALLQYFFGIVLFQFTGIRFFAIIGWGSENSKILPAFALAFGSMASIGRLMRSSMLDVLSQDYIRTAKVKGIKKKDIVLHHCLRNALMPVITVLGPMTAVLLTGTFAVEYVFSIPGLGKYFVDSVQANDYPVIIGTTLFFGVFLVLCNLIVDILNSYIDPRVKLGGEENR